MGHTHTFYQNIDNEDVMASLEDTLAYLPLQCEVRWGGKSYKVVDIEDHIKNFDRVSRTIWCKEITTSN